MVACTFLSAPLMVRADRTTQLYVIDVLRYVWINFLVYFSKNADSYKFETKQLH